MSEKLKYPLGVRLGAVLSIGGMCLSLVDLWSCSYTHSPVDFIVGGLTGLISSTAAIITAMTCNIYDKQRCVADSISQEKTNR
jgi:hypothetical protein